MEQLHLSTLFNRAHKITPVQIQQALFLLIIFFLPSQYGKHYWPPFSIVAGIRVDYLSPTLYFTDILIILLIITWLLQLLIYNFKFQIKYKYFNLKYLSIKNSFQITNYKLQIILVIFLISLLIGISISLRPPAGFYGLLRLGELVIFAWIALRLLSEKKLHRQLVLAFAGGMLVQSLLAIAQFYNQGSLGGFAYFLGERTFTSQTPGIANASLNGILVLRPYGTLPHPNVLGGYLLIGTIFLISNIKNQIFPIRSGSRIATTIGTNIKRVFLISTIALSSVALLLSMSRTAIFLGVFIILYYLIKRLTFLARIESSSDKAIPTLRGSPRRVISRIHIYKNIILPVIVFLCAIAILFSPLAPRFFFFDTAEEAVTQRKELAVASLKMFRDHPLMGVGLQNFLIALPKYVLLYQVPLQPVHNIYLLIAAETGLIGLASVIYSLYLLYRKIRVKNNTSFSGSKSLLFAVILLGFTDHYLLTLQQGKLLLSLIVVIVYARFYITFGLRQGKIRRKKAIRLS